MGHHDDGLWRRDDSPIISDGGTDESREDPQCDDLSWDECMVQMEEDWDMWRKLFEDCNKKQGQEIERLRQEYKERSEQMALTTAVEKVIPTRDIPRGQSPMELLTPREMIQTTETRLPAETNRVTIPDPSDTLGDPVVEQTVRKLIETAGRLVANKNAPGSGVTAPGSGEGPREKNTEDASEESVSHNRRAKE